MVEFSWSTYIFIFLYSDYFIFIFHSALQAKQCMHFKGYMDLQYVQEVCEELVGIN